MLDVPGCCEAGVCDCDAVHCDDDEGVDGATTVVVADDARVSSTVSGLEPVVPSTRPSFLPCCSAHSCKPAVSSCHPKNRVISKGQTPRHTCKQAINSNLLRI